MPDAGPSTASPDIGIDPSWQTVIHEAGSLAAEGKKVAADIDTGVAVRKELVHDLLQKKPPPAPDIQPPLAPPQQPGNSSSFEAFGNVAVALAMFGSLLTRKPLTTALNAAAGAMQGYQQGQRQLFEENLQTWKLQSDYASKVAQWQLDRYNAVMDEYEGDQSKLLAAISAIAAIDHDAGVAHAAKVGDLQMVADLLYDRQNLVNQYNIHRDALAHQADELAETKRFHTAEIEHYEREDENRAQAQKQKEAIKAAGAKQTDVIINQIDDLVKLVQDHPEVVSTAGMVTRMGETIEGWIGGQPQDTPASRFASAILALRTQVSTALSGSRYYSKPRQEQMEQILPGLEHFESPQQVINNLIQMKNILNNAKLDAEIDLDSSTVIINRGTGERFIGRDGQWQPIPPQQ